MEEFKITFTKVSQKDIDSIDARIKFKLLKAIKLLEVYPFPRGDIIKKLKGAHIPIYRLRVGDFRVVYHIDGRNIVVFFIVDRKDFEKRLRAFF